MLTAEQRDRIEIAVSNSAEVMDDLRPDWFALVDTKAFDIDDADGCIAGQVWPHRAFKHTYMNMLRPAFMARFDGKDAFMSVHNGTTEGSPSWGDERLYTNECWLTEIAERREMDAILEDFRVDLVLAGV